MADDARSIDSAPHPRFRSYSAQNFAEVAPPRLSIVSWSLVGDPTERALRGLVDRVWPAADWHTGSHYVFVGYFSCRPYHNLAALCHLASEVPGLTPADVTASYFQDVDAPPAATARASGRGGRSAGVPRLARELLGLRRRLTLVEGRVADLEELAGRAVEAGDAFELGRAFDRAREVLDEAWSVHFVATAGLPPVRALQRALGERVVPHWDDVEPWLNRPHELVWDSLHDATRLDHPLRASEFLAFPFYEVASGEQPWSGHASPPAPAPPAAGAPRAGMVEPAEAIWGMLRGRRAALLRRVANAVSDTMAARESSKSLAMRCLHVFRTMLPTVAEVRGLEPGAWPYVTVDELAAGDRGAALAQLAERRREECAGALAEEMPDELDFSAAGRRAAALPPAGADGRGRGVSPGAVTGVVVGRDVDGAGRDLPRILVCETVDADLVAVLPLVDGIVTARGSVLSHVSIIARERGIPAVVGYRRASDLRPGQLVSVDGTTGEVEPVGG